MTMPHERMRALRWGHEALAAMPLDPTLPEVCRTQAQRLTQEHPTAKELAQWVQDGRQGLPPHWAAAIVEAHALLMKTRVRTEGSPATQRALLFALRHYPDPSMTRLMASDCGLGVWLELEQ